MSPEELVVLLGAVLALVFAYFPWLGPRRGRLPRKGST